MPGLALEYVNIAGVGKRLGRADRPGSALAPTFVTPADEATVAPGTVPLRVTTTGSPLRVTFRVGEVFYPGTEGPAGTWTYQFDTTKNPNNGSSTSHDMGVQWRATAVYADGQGGENFFPTVNRQLKTSNFPVSPLPIAGGWRSAQAWAADYTSLSAWEASYDTLRGHNAGAPYTKFWSLVQDPTPPPARPTRKVIRVVANNDVDRTNEGTAATNDSEQPTGNVRFQCQPSADSPRGIIEGDELCVGFSFMMGQRWPTMYGNNDPEDPDAPDSNGMGYINIFQLFGPDNPTGITSNQGAEIAYIDGSIFTLGVRRYIQSDQKNVIESQETYSGNDGKHIIFPYLPFQWVDIVIRMHVSLSIERGWVEMYANWGQGTSVQPLQVGGKTRIPRILRRNAGHAAHRVDQQIYRRADEIDTLEAYFAGHKYAQTVAQADPLSYA